MDEDVMYAIIAARHALLSTWREEHETGNFPDLIVKADTALSQLESEARRAAKRKRIL